MKSNLIKILANQILEERFGFTINVVEESEDDEESEDEISENNEETFKNEKCAPKLIMTKKEYLRQCQNWTDNHSVFIDEYSEFKQIVDKIGGYFEEYSFENFKIDLKKGLKELQSINYHKIDGKMVIRKTVRFKK